MGEARPAGAAARAQVGEKGHQGHRAALQPTRLSRSVIPAGEDHMNCLFLQSGTESIWPFLHLYRGSHNVALQDSWSLFLMLFTCSDWSFSGSS